MSVWEQILIDLRNIIQDSETFHDVDVYYDESEMNPNISLPAISFRVGLKTTISSKP